MISSYIRLSVAVHPDPTTMAEQWREIRGYPDYEVSDRGRVRSWRTPRSKGRRLRPLMLKFNVVRGRLRVCLWCNGKGKQQLVHRLVLLTFVGEPPEAHECCHYNGNPQDNRLSNLRWDTRSGNMGDDIRNKAHGSRKYWLEYGPASNIKSRKLVPRIKRAEAKVKDAATTAAWERALCRWQAKGEPLDAMPRWYEFSNTHYPNDLQKA